MTAAGAAAQPNFKSNDYYEILGVPRGADDHDLKKAFRTHARKYHPDKDPDNAEATKNFQKLGEAYATLSNHIARKAYDEGGKEGVDDYEREEEARYEASSKAPSKHAAGEEEEDEEHYFHRPMTPEETKAYYRSMFGEFQEQYYSPGSRVGFPYAEDLRDSLLASELADKLSFQFGRFKITFFMTWIIKKEISPTKTFLEIVFTWIVILSWFASAGNEDNMTNNIVGGLCLLGALLIMHFWYGFLRYPSLTRCCSAGAFEREACDENFNDLRDECSIYYHGDDKRRPQWKAVLTTIPFSIINHMAALIASMCYCIVYRMMNQKEHYVDKRRNWNGTRNVYSVDTMSADEITTGSARFGLLVAIAMFPIMRIWGGFPAITFATLTLLFNQHLYNSMLFRKRYRDFLLSLVFGNLFVITEIDYSEHPKIEEKEADEEMGLGEDQDETQFETERGGHDIVETPDDFDVCFGDEDHPGTMYLRQTVRTSTEQFEKFDGKTLKAIKSQLKGRHFFIQDSSNTPWREASKKELEVYCEVCFNEENVKKQNQKEEEEEEQARTLGKPHGSQKQAAKNDDDPGQAPSPPANRTGNDQSESEGSDSLKTPTTTRKSKRKSTKIKSILKADNPTDNDDNDPSESTEALEESHASLFSQEESIKTQTTKRKSKGKSTKKSSPKVYDPAGGGDDNDPSESTEPLGESHASLFGQEEATKTPATKRKSKRKSTKIESITTKADSPVDDGIDPSESTSPVDDDIDPSESTAEAVGESCASLFSREESITTKGTKGKSTNKSSPEVYDPAGGDDNDPSESTDPLGGSHASLFGQEEATKTPATKRKSKRKSTNIESITTKADSPVDDDIDPSESTEAFGESCASLFSQEESITTKATKGKSTKNKSSPKVYDPAGSDDNDPSESTEPLGESHASLFGQEEVATKRKSKRKSTKRYSRKGQEREPKEPTDYGVCFVDDDREGTKAFHLAVCSVVAECPDAEYAPHVYIAIKRKLKGRSFFVKDERTGSWYEANKRELVLKFKDAFNKEKEKYPMETGSTKEVMEDLD